MILRTLSTCALFDDTSTRFKLGKKKKKMMEEFRRDEDDAKGGNNESAS